MTMVLIIVRKNIKLNKNKMEAKLIKKDESYFLQIQPYALSYLQFDKPNVHILQLSSKNCQSIERGYDLDELAKNLYKESLNYHLQNELDYTFGVIDGFQKALELMGDKKFSEEDIHEVYSLGEAEDRFGFHDFLQQNNQTEWDVEIIEECLDKDCDGVDRKGDCITTGKPKLDAEGCLILKKI